MARCNRCNKFSLFGTKSGFCSNCETIIAQEEAERQRQAEEERRRQEEAERQRRAEEERRRQEEAERQRRAEEERRRKEEAERQRRAEEERQRRAEEERRRKEEAERQRHVEEERRRKEEAERQKQYLAEVSNDPDITSYLISFIGEKDNSVMNCVNVEYGGGRVMFFFADGDVVIHNKKAKLISWAAFTRPDKSAIAMFFVRPTNSSEQFSVYYMTAGWLPKKLNVDLNCGLRIFSYGACRWYAAANGYPIGFDWKRLHDECKELDPTLEHFKEDFVVKDNCKFLPRQVHTLMFGDVQTL